MWHRILLDAFLREVLFNLYLLEIHSALPFMEREHQSKFEQSYYRNCYITAVQLHFIGMKQCRECQWVKAIQVEWMQFLTFEPAVGCPHWSLQSIIRIYQFRYRQLQFCCIHLHSAWSLSRILFKITELRALRGSGVLQPFISDFCRHIL